ncbi:MAG: hypothetical protein HC836_47515 [Richelia sp. RM2_1_2]|nr:hypothetical protein [Richelia sp. RM2_1_2]
MVDNPLTLSLKARLKILEQENIELKRQIQSLTKLVPQSSMFEVSDEQIICETEVKRLRDIALSRPLNLEETKKLDILLKNLKSIKETNKEKVIEINKAMDISLNDLIEIASENEENGQSKAPEETGSDS